MVDFAGTRRDGDDKVVARQEPANRRANKKKRKTESGFHLESEKQLKWFITASTLVPNASVP